MEEIIVTFISRAILRCLDHVQLDTPCPVGLLCSSDQLVAEAATYTTRNTRKRGKSMPQWDSKLHSQQSSGLRPTPPESVPVYIASVNTNVNTLSYSNTFWCVRFRELYFSHQHVENAEKLL